MYIPRSSIFYIAAFLLLQSIHVVAVVLPRASSSNSATNPAESVKALINSINTSGANLVGNVTSDLSVSHYTITQDANDPLLRAVAITTKRAGFLYGPPLAGGPFFPTGPLGTARVSTDLLELQSDGSPELTGAVADDIQATANLPQYDGLKTVNDYTKLYQNNWKNTLPRGTDPGAETNFSQDLFFSMERLSDSPYQVRRLNPSSDTLAFSISNKISEKVSGSTLTQLFNAGRLFYADYSDQASLPKTTRYGAACDAYFYIDTSSGDFLPLAIRTNVGANLIYTPEDSTNDWLLAKMMLNVNDFWFAQWCHLAQTHEVVQIAYMAAIRTLSEQHPVLVMLNRLMYEVFAIQPLAKVVLFTPGTVVDEIFANTGTAAQDYTTNLYQNRGKGAFQSNYFQAELQNRGLINSTIGPALKNFPFYEDASTIWNAQNTFMTAFVNSYYASDSVIKGDTELQNWVQEAQGPAEAIDFPSISTTADLIAVLTHFAHLASTSHHTVNTNELLELSSTLPFHPPSLYQPIPTSKGVKDVAPYLPPFHKVLVQLTVGALFARPKFVGTNRTLIHQFDDPAMLQRMNTQTQNAAATFQSTMQSFSAQVSARTFDSSGLSQGMPFVWKALDPNVAPYSITT